MTTPHEQERELPYEQQREIDLWWRLNGLASEAERLRAEPPQQPPSHPSPQPARSQ